MMVKMLYRKKSWRSILSQICVLRAFDHPILRLVLENGGWKLWRNSLTAQAWHDHTLNPECWGLLSSHYLFFLSAIVCPWLDFGLPPRCPQVVWCHWGEIELFFCHAGSGRVDRVWSAREKSLKILQRGWELNPGHREDRQWAIPLSYHDPGNGEDRQWAIPLSYHDPGHREDRQWAIPLSYHDPGYREVSELSHWAIMATITCA